MPVMAYNLLYNNDKQTENVIGYNLKPDILIHGSPCKDFSVMGRKLGGFINSNTQSSLMWETVRIIEEFGNWKPKIILWENVKGVLYKNNIDNFNMYIKALDKLGYKSVYKILNAKNFGLPHNRNRVFVVSIHKDSPYTFDFDNINYIDTPKLIDFLPNPYDVDDKYYMKLTINDIKTKATHGDGIYLDQLSRGKANYCKNISSSIKAQPGHAGIVLGDKIRKLTPKEEFLLFGFKEDDFNKLAHLPNTHLYKLIGNSIPVPILEAIFKELFMEE